MSSNDGLRVGFIGSGRRVTSIARRLAMAFGSLSIFDASRDCRDDIEIEGAFACQSPAALRARSDVVVTLLSDEAELGDVLFGPAGLTQSEDNRRVPAILDVTSLFPWIAQDIAARCRQRGVTAFGGSIVTHAHDRGMVSTLYVDSAALANDKLHAVAHALGDTVVPTGRTGNAMAVALLTGLMVGVNSAVAGEALAMGRKAGLDTAMLTRLLLKGSGATAVMAMQANARTGDAGVATAHRVELRKTLQRASDAALRVDHSLYFGTAAIASLLVQQQFLAETPDDGHRATG